MRNNKIVEQTLQISCFPDILNSHAIFVGQCGYGNWNPAHLERNRVGKTDLDENTFIAENDRLIIILHKEVPLVFPC